MQAIYALRDTRARDLVAIMLFRHDAPAIRAFGDTAANPETMVHRHPQDFELVRLGYVDESTHVVDAESEPVVIITGAAWKAAQNPEGQQ